MTKLSVLCVSKCEPYTKRFFTHFRAIADIFGAEFVLAHDRCNPPDCGADKYLSVEASGTIEDVLIDAHRACSGEYVLRLDDDETLSAHAIFLVRGMIEEDLDGRIYAFPRANLIEDESTAIVSGSLFPDFQVRLMPRDAENRTLLHEGLSPNEAIKGLLLHHKFLVKSVDERRAMAAAYEIKRSGCGTGHYLQFSVPEDVFHEFEVMKFSTGWVNW